MGTNLTKIGHAEKKVGPSEAHVPSTPILTPNTRFFDLDPRSPSANIVRTPIQVINNLQGDSPVIGEINTSHIDLDESCELCANYDPRSPSVEFTRTPIILEKQQIKLRNKALDNVRKQMIDTTPFKTNEKTNNCIANVRTPPKLLESHSIIKKTTTQNEKRKSHLGLLQTNLDYIETDLDNVKSNTSFNRIESKVKELPDEQLFTSEDQLLASNKPASDEQLPVLNEQLLASDELIFDEHLSTSKETEVNNHTEITERDVIEANYLLEKQDSINSKNIIEEIDEEVKNLALNINDDLYKSLEENRSKNEIQESTESKIDPENLITEFDKKITNLIYEDTNSIVTPTKLSIPKESGRTPLGDRNYNDNVKIKSLNKKLKVHDKPLKTDYTVSKIPVFKTKKSLAFVQCENTPPNVKTTESRLKKSMWDAEKTLII